MPSVPASRRERAAAPPGSADPAGPRRRAGSRRRRGGPVRSILAAIAILGGLGLAVPLARAETFIWVDEQGVTHLTDDPERAQAAAAPSAEGDVEALRSLWHDGLAGPPVSTPRGSSSSEDARIVRLLRGAAADLERGESARAAATLRSILRLDPNRPEAHWYLAELDRQRGRYASAEDHLRAFLSNAGDGLRPWRIAAERRLAGLADEQRLADETRPRGELQLAAVESAHFRVELDRELGGADSRYADTALRFLEEARQEVSRAIGVAPDEPLGVVFYGKAAYQQTHGHRFSFRTVGFFDGRIHVSSPAHPSDDLRALLFHEYTHAVFREQTGGDRPYWLNEGLAEHVERRARRQPISTRSERASLNARLRADRWIPLRRLGPGFSGLKDEDARAAYLQAIVTVDWIEARTAPEDRARLLARLGEGVSADQALHEILGLDVDGLDAAVQESVRSEFPEI